MENTVPGSNDNNKKNINTNTIVAIAIIVLGVCLLGLLLFYLFTNNKSNNNNGPTNTPTTSGSPIATTAPGGENMTMFELPESTRGKAFWSGKRMAILGDSITAMNGFQGKLREYTGLEFIYQNDTYAISGTQLTGTNQSFTQRAPTITNRADVIMVFGGTNDFHVGAPIGDISDPAGTDTIYAALRSLCETFKRDFPNAVVFFATPLQRTNPPGSGSVEGINGAGLTLDAYVEAIIKICAEFEYPVLDFYHTSIITKDTAAQYLFDGLHPNQDGFAVLAKEIAEFMCPGEIQ